MKKVLACDLGGTNLRMSVVNSEGEILCRVKTETPQKSLDELIKKINSLIQECQNSVESVEALSIAVPAALDAEKGVIFKAPNLPFLDGLQITKILEDSVRMPCFVENDANAAAVGEHAFGAAKSKRSFIMVTLGTGVGGGIIIENKLWRGYDGTAGEIGHICVEPNGVYCGCGSRGCLEQYASASAVVRITKEMRREHPKSLLHSKLYLSSEDVFNAAIRKDKLALKVFEKMGFYLGVGLASLINVLNPEAIVIGGGGSNAWDLFIPHTTTQIRKRAYEAPAKRAELLKASLGDDAGILGAAKLAFDKIN